MTSANVVNYTIFNKEGVEVGSHRQNVMCHINNDSLEKFVPASEYTILPSGYDEEEEYWEGEKQNLEKWLLKNKATITNKEFKKVILLISRKKEKLK